MRLRARHPQPAYLDRKSSSMRRRGLEILASGGADGIGSLWRRHKAGVGGRASAAASRRGLGLKAPRTAVAQRHGDERRSALMLADQDQLICRGVIAAASASSGEASKHQRNGGVAASRRLMCVKAMA